MQRFGKVRGRWRRSARKAWVGALSVAVVVGASLVMAGSPASAAYAGRNGRILFARSNQIYTIASTGGTAVKITSSGKNYWAKWSPDGKRIAYVNEPTANVRNVWVMRADGSGRQRVTSLGTVEGAPAWSPDGTTLAFAAAGYLHTIRSTSPFGSPVKPVGVFTGCWDCGPDDPVTDIYVDRYVAWSPDGTRIALYNHFDPRYDDAIYMYYPATGEAAQLTATGGDCSRSWRDLFWSAGGQFGYTAESLGGDCTVHPPRIIYPGFAWVDGDAGGAPSPDGRFMALTNASSGSARVYVANIDGTGRRLLTTGYQPDWQPRP